MKFKQATIHGFGKWTDVIIDFTTENLSCFYGENEAGKSTLQQFLLYMLFGLEPRKRKQFRPKNRTEIGGILRLIDAGLGEFTIHRKEDIFKCFLENGETKDEKWWQEHLAGLTREVYTSIYAFSAPDLSRIQSMKANELSDVLFSVSLTGSTAIYEVEKSLLTGLEQLFKERGKNPLLNQQINKTFKAYHQLQEERSTEGAYQSLNEQLLHSHQQLDKIQKEITSLQREILTEEKVLQTLPEIHQLITAKRELLSIPSELIFPKDGLKRFEDVKNRMLPLQSESSFHCHKIEEYKNELENLLAKKMTVEEVEDIKQLVECKPLYEQRSYTILEKEHHYKVMEERRQELLYELEWETNQTPSGTLPFHLETSWQDLLDDYKAFQSNKINLQQQHTIRTEKHQRISQEISNVYEQLIPKEEQEYLEDKLRSANKINNDPSSATSLKQWGQKRESQSRKILYGIGIIAIISLIIALVGDQPMFYAIAILAGLFGSYQYIFTRHQVHTISFMTDDTDDNAPLTTSERNRFTQQLQNQENNIIAIRHMEQQIKQLEMEEEEYLDTLNLLTNKEMEIQERINNERLEFPFLCHLEIAHWLELLRMVRELQHVEQRMKVEEEEIEQLREKNRAIDKRLAEFGEGSTFKDIQQVITAQDSIINAVNQYNKEIINLKDKQLFTKKQLEQLTKEEQELFKTADVKMEEEYYNKANLLHKQKELEETIRNLYQKLQRMFTQDVIEQLLIAIPQEVELIAKIETVTSNLQENQRSVSEYQKQIARLQMEINQLENKDNASSSAYQYQIEKDSLNQMQKQWAIIKLAYSALQKAKRSYQEKYMEEVMKHTSNFFQMLTSGRYIEVFPPTNKKLFQVEAKDNIRYTVDELSQGTIDQLYVSLRFSIAKVMSDTYQVPLLVDDAFVHFDDRRTTQATTLLKNMATEQQVLFFTCKEATSNALNAEQMRVKDLVWT